MHTLNILTRCSRPQNLREVYASIQKLKDTLKLSFDISWWLLIDTSAVKEIDAEFLFEVQASGDFVLFLKGLEGDYGHGLLNACLDSIHNGFVYFLDDDNTIHPDFDQALKLLCSEYPKKKALIVSQKVAGKDFTGLDLREAKPENVKIQGIDMAQFILARELIGKTRFARFEYTADGRFIEQLYKENPESFRFTEGIYCYYNFLSSKQSFTPKVLCLGSDSFDLYTNSLSQQDSNKLQVLHIEGEEGLNTSIPKYRPDAILTLGSDWDKFDQLQNAPEQLRKRWIHCLEHNQDTGNHVYIEAINCALDRNNQKLISFFTPIYNLGQRLKTTYQSLKDQTYNNWEWVIVNDSTDGGKTLKVAEEIASNDFRVHLYDFREKSNGNIGEVKYRAAMLCNGSLIAELDHDDYLLPDCAETLINMQERYPQAGFFYSDFAELDYNWNSLKYPDGFAFGYGGYRNEIVLEKEIDVCCSINLNPKTVRHIVGMPNHIRAWRRSTYFEIGGHNRQLCVADDYELCLLTFLKTRMLRIPKLCYLQFINPSGSNTHYRARQEIQRRVKVISYHYNEQIKQRFEELGAEDWAYNKAKNSPLETESLFGNKENYVNLIADLK